MKLVSSKIIIVLFVIAIFTRTFWLDRFPNGITNDELHFVLNAKAVFYGFTDMSGIWSPLSLTSIPDNPSAELTSPLLAPFLGPVTLNLFNTRLLFAIVSSIFVIIIYLLTSEISPKIGLIAGLLTIINPWFFYLGRIAFDQPLATFFLTLFFYSLLKLKKHWILLSLIPALLGFYTYIGTKVIFLPFVIFSLLSVWLKNHRRYSLQYLFVFFICLLSIAHFVYSVLTGPSRLGELVTPFSPQITAAVETERSLSSPSPLTRLFINRFTVYSYFFTRKYLNSFSPDVFFNLGDSTYLISLWKHGYFYYIDLPFLIFGLYFLFRHHRRYFFTLTSFILLSPIPEAVRSDLTPAYAFHSCLQYPFLIPIIASGIYFIIRQFPKLTFPIFIIYLFLFIDLLNLYFFRYPIYQPEGFSFTNRILSEYIKRERALGHQVVVVTTEPSNLFRQYLFYSEKYTSSNFSHIKNIYQHDRYNLSFDDVFFTNQYPTTLSQPNTVYLTQSSFFRSDQPHLAIRHLSNGHELFSIYNSTLCPDVIRNPLTTFSLTDFNLSSQSLNFFCQKFISSD